MVSCMGFYGQYNHLTPRVEPKDKGALPVQNILLSMFEELYMFVTIMRLCLSCLFSSFTQSYKLQEKQLHLWVRVGL